MVGKLNEAKLGNFPEVDVFVLIASPQDSLMDSKEYPRPLITLFELDLALNSDREWTGDFNPDFEEVLDTSTIPSEEIHYFPCYCQCLNVPIKFFH